MSEDQDKQNNDGQETRSSDIEIEKNDVKPIQPEDSPQESSKPDSSKEPREEAGKSKIDDGSGSVNFNVDSVGKNAFIAQHMKNEIDAVNKIIIEGIGGISSHIKKFSSSDLIQIPEDQLEEAFQTFVYPAEEIEQLVSALISKRILLLVGQPESGKYFTAQYLANRLSKEDTKDYKINLAKPQPKEYIINFSELIDDPRLLKNTILIFKDALSKKNKSLLDFFASYAKEQTEQFSKKLKALDAYIIFTIDVVASNELEIPELDIKKNIFPIDDKRLETVFDRKLKYVCSIQEIDHDDAIGIFKGRKNEILKRLHRISNISLFIKNYLGKILAGDKKIDEAIQEAKEIEMRLKYWFLIELGENKEEFETWTFALCLALLNGAPYVNFEKLHKTITENLLRAINPHRPIIKFSYKLSESKLAAKCNAQIIVDSAYHADIIEFTDSEYEDVLMDILLKNNRRILSNIIPYLQEYVENPYHWSLRRLAAYSIGRIGELDVDSITINFIKKWQYANEDFCKASVGYLFEGILNSKDENYKRFCLGYLKNMGLDNDIRIRWTAISVYKQIGFRNLGLAMKELRKIQEKTVEQMLKSENMLDIFYQKGVSEEEILENLDILYKKTGYLWANIRYSVIALCFMFEDGPLKVFNELRKWIDKGNRNTKITVILFFLGPNGILNEFEDQKMINLSDDDEKSLSSNMLLNSLTVGDEAIKEMVLFLKDLYEKCFPKFRRSGQEAVNYRELKIILLNHLEKWVVDNLSKIKIIDALKLLFVQLYNSGGKDFRRTLYESMKRWKIPKKKEKMEEREKEEKEKEEKKEAKLKAFVNEVTDRIFDLN